MPRLQHLEMRKMLRDHVCGISDEAQMAYNRNTHWKTTSNENTVNTTMVKSNSVADRCLNDPTYRSTISDSGHTLAQHSAVGKILTKQPQHKILR